MPIVDSLTRFFDYLCDLSGVECLVAISDRRRIAQEEIEISQLGQSSQATDGELLVRMFKETEAQKHDLRPAADRRRRRLECLGDAIIEHVKRQPAGQFMTDQKLPPALDFLHFQSCFMKSDELHPKFLKELTKLVEEGHVSLDIIRKGILAKAIHETVQNTECSNDLQMAEMNIEYIRALYRWEPEFKDRFTRDRFPRTNYIYQLRYWYALDLDEYERKYGPTMKPLDYRGNPKPLWERKQHCEDLMERNDQGPRAWKALCQIGWKAETNKDLYLSSLYTQKPEPLIRTITPILRQPTIDTKLLRPRSPGSAVEDVILIKVEDRVEQEFREELGDSYDSDGHRSAVALIIRAKGSGWENAVKWLTSRKETRWLLDLASDNDDIRYVDHNVRMYIHKALGTGQLTEVLACAEDRDPRIRIESLLVLRLYYPEASAAQDALEKGRQDEHEMIRSAVDGELPDGIRTSEPNMFTAKCPECEKRLRLFKDRKIEMLKCFNCHRLVMPEVIKT